MITMTIQTSLNNDCSFPASKDEWHSGHRVLNNVIKPAYVSVHIRNLLVDLFNLVDKLLQAVQSLGFHIEILHPQFASISNPLLSFIRFQRDALRPLSKHASTANNNNNLRLNSEKTISWNSAESSTPCWKAQNLETCS